MIRMIAKHQKELRIPRQKEKKGRKAQNKMD
jgi:hypothetical protein